MTKTRLTLLAERFGRDERGGTAIEYALICSLIVLVIVGAIGATGGGVGNGWTSVSNKVTAVMP